ncbi:hypothetical protein TNCT_483321 [Trichonephila clavata]|uniref:Uncharacterized protein n=1 Tax=Trichonephila clavata TaxID=2740835 RepID=A0A8X6K6S2_TRICU|nr:hypothetical protein TNCT_483321 [Trichonephila clavata]
MKRGKTVSIEMQVLIILFALKREEEKFCVAKEYYFSKRARGLRKAGRETCGISAFRFQFALVGIDWFRISGRSSRAVPILFGKARRFRISPATKGAFLPYLDNFREYAKRKTCARPRGSASRQCPFGSGSRSQRLSGFRISPGREPARSLFFDPGRAGNLRGVLKNRGQLVFDVSEVSNGKDLGAPAEKDRGRSGTDLGIGRAVPKPNGAFRRSRTDAGSVGTLSDREARARGEPRGALSSSTAPRFLCVFKESTTPSGASGDL